MHCHCHLQLAKLRSNPSQAPVTAGTKLPDDDIALLRQRVAELEQVVQESKTGAITAVNGEETGQFFFR